MSYTIEYDRQFIKSDLGITPLWLCGDNNVTVGRGKYEKRDRSWHVFCNMLACTQEELLAAVEAWKGGPYQEHWRKNGKWVNDDALSRWVVNGCRNAATIEDVRAVNTLGSIKCCLHDFSGGGFAKETHVSWVSTTEELDAWIREVKPLVKPGEVFPIISLNWDQPVKHISRSTGNEDDKVCIKRGRSYLVKMDKVKLSISWSSNIADGPLVMTRKEAEDLLANFFPKFRENPRIVSAKVLENPHNVVLVMSGRGMDCVYVCALTSRGVSYTTSAIAAKKYASIESARRTIAKIKERLPDVEVGIMSV